MTVIGAGSWGTALAILLAREGHPTQLWGRDPAQLEAMRHARRNQRYLPDAAFPEALQVAGTCAQALKEARDALIAVPSHAFRATLQQIQPHLGSETRIAWATKGFEIASGMLPHQVAREVLGARPGAVLSGPTFAKEVGAGLPTAMTVASADEHFAKELALEPVGTQFPRLYADRHHGCGGGRRREKCHRHRLGHRRRHGIRRQHARGVDHPRPRGNDAAWESSSARSAKLSWDWQVSETWCSPAPTTNRAIAASAWRLGRGESPARRKAPFIRSSRACRRRAPCTMWRSASSVDMPICREIYRIIYENKPVRAAVQALMGREVRSETGIAFGDSPTDLRSFK